VSAPASRSRPLGACLLGLAACLAAVALLGPLATGVIHWRIRPTILSELYGLDAVSLGVVAPLAATAGVLALRGRPAGALLGFPCCAYAVYMVPQYVLGPDYAHIAGDNERWFPLLLALYSLGVAGAALAWARLQSVDLGAPSRVERLVARRWLPAAAAVVFVRYLPALADWTSAAPQAKDYLAGPGFAWAIALLDLGVALPATVAVCVGYRRAARWARPALYALSGWFALVGAAVAGMAIAMELRGDPAMTAAQAFVMTLLGGVLAALAIALYAPVIRGAAARTPPARRVHPARRTAPRTRVPRDPSHAPRGRRGAR